MYDNDEYKSVSSVLLFVNTENNQILKNAGKKKGHKCNHETV